MDGNEQSDANSPWQYRPEGATSAPVVAPVAPQQAPEVTMPRSVATPPTGPDGTITWTASEFVAHQKSSTWYVLLTVGALVVTALIWIVTKDVIAAVVILFAVGAFGIIAARQPRDLSYQLDQSGLTMGTRHHAYKEFRSYSIMSEGAIKSVVLVPLKRFSPLTTVHYDPGDEVKILALLNSHLPFEERRRDPIDSLMWRIRF